MHPVPNENEDEIINNFPELFDCFSNDGFDTERFKLFARHFLSNKPESSDKRQNELFEKEKAKVVSVLAQNLYTMFTLSKEQMKNITAFWKAMIVFISPASETTANKIRVSYAGCLREAQKKCATINTRHLQMFRDCWFFALAIDTAQFCRSHFMSCVARFGFEDRISQEVLFFERVSETTGQKMARFVVGKLE